MSKIYFSSAKTLDNASVEYSYPEMNIKNISKDTTIPIADAYANNIVKFYFQNSSSKSFFNFIDSSNNKYISGIASQGIISKGIHNDSDGSLYEYELTVKHIYPTSDSEFFYVVFPLKEGGDTSIIDLIQTVGDNQNINVFDEANKIYKNISLNLTISSTYGTNGSDVFQYVNNNSKNVFVYNTPIQINITPELFPNIQHNLWSSAQENVNKITSTENLQINEEIECDYSGDFVSPVAIDNKPLSTKFSKVGYVSIIFFILGMWIASFNKFIDPYFKIAIGVNAFLIILLFGLVYGYNKKLSMYSTPEAILVFLVLIWPIDVIFRSILFWVFKLINLTDAVNYPNFVFGFLNNEINDDNKVKQNKYATYSIGVMLVIWAMTAVSIMVSPK
jgi:hypothetical protein